MATRRAAFQKPRFAPDFPYQDVFDDLWDIWRKHILVNQKKNKYYEAKNTLQDLGLSIPPPLTALAPLVASPSRPSWDGLRRRLRPSPFAPDSTGSRRTMRTQPRYSRGFQSNRA